MHFARARVARVRRVYVKEPPLIFPDAGGISLEF